MFPATYQRPNAKPKQVATCMQVHDDRHSRRMQAVFRERAIAALSDRLHSSLTSLQGNARADMERLLETQQELQQRGIQLRMAVRLPDTHASYSGSKATPMLLHDGAKVRAPVRICSSLCLHHFPDASSVH